MKSWTRPPKLFRKIFPSSIWKCWLSQDVLFSFDDGPGPHTNALLDLSLEDGVKCAFFILPEQANKYPEIISRILEDGHILGTHFLKHRNHILDTKTIFLNSLNESIQKIENISQNTIEFCRLPYGRILPWQEKWIIQNGSKHVFWSLDSKDYRLETKEKVITRIMNNIRSGDIVLMHDGEANHPKIVQIVDKCLQSTK